MLTPEQIAEMDSITGLGDTQMSSGANRVKQLQSLRLQQGGLRGRFFETVGDIKDTAKGVGESFKKGAEKVSESIDKYSQGEQRLSDTVLQTVGAGAGAVSGAAGDIVTGIAKAVVPQKVENFVEKGIQKVVKPITQSQKVQSLIEKYEILKETDPITAANIEGALGIGELALDFVGGKAGKQAVKKGLDVSESVANVAKKGADLAGDTSKFLVGKTSGLSPDTISYLVNNPKDYTKAVESGITRAGVANDFFEVAQSKIDEVAETGAQYQPIRESGFVVNNVDPDFLDKYFSREGFNVKNGIITPTTKSATRDATEIAKLQEFYDTWNPAIRRESLDAEEILNLRKDIGDMSKFDRATGKAPVSEKLSKGIYENVNNSIASKVPGLRELDEQFAPIKKELSGLQKEFLTKDADGNWQLKDTAINKIINSTGKGKDNVAARLESYMPGITEKVRVAKVLEDIDYAKGRNVGAYLQGGSIYAGIATGNIPLAVAGIVVSSPTIVTKLLVTTGIAKEAANKLTEKITKGIKLTIGEQKVLKKALNTVNKDNLSTLFGVPAGVETVDQLFTDSTTDSYDE